MPGAGFTVTKAARRATRIGGSLDAADKALANRRSRRNMRQVLTHDGAEADLLPKLWTDWDVI